jgi:quercetin dioxygenase-like cupin family protein
MFGTRRYAALAAVGVVGAITATVALATGPIGETPRFLGHGRLVAAANVDRKVTGGRVSIKTQGALDATMVGITIAPGGTGGWHKHAGPVIATVVQGTLTIIDRKCKLRKLTAGKAVISPGSSTEKDENRGSTPLVFYVTLLLPHGVFGAEIPEPAPAGCHA